MPSETGGPPIGLRIVLVGTGLAIWYGTQALLKYRPNGVGTLGDGLHALTERPFRYLSTHARVADWLLIVSSFGIDCLGVFVLVQSVIGPSVQPFVGLFLLFVSRQVCQALCALPPPEGMIWRSPGVPSLLVTYGVSNDLFFSGHTALAVYGAIELGRWGGPMWAVFGAVIAAFEATTVLLLRAHYTMDVFTGAIAAFVATTAADHIAAACDAALLSVSSLF